jgi:hypothetical protein
VTIGSPPNPVPPPATTTLAVGTKLIRFYDPARGAWDAHRFYGPLSFMRFDHQLPPLGTSPDRSVWYASTALVGAVAESFGNAGVVDRACGRRVVVARAVGALTVVDLVGLAARRVGLTQEVGAATDYAKTQEWARAFYDQHPQLVGIRWRGRQSGSICFVLNDRTPMGLLALVSDHAINDPHVWPRVARAARRCSLRVI